MAGEREWILRTGQTVWLRTSPVDPRDAFRGDYLTLGYEVSSIPPEAIGADVQALIRTRPTAPVGATALRESEIYVSLRTDANGLAEVVTTSLVRPRTGPCMKGRVRPGNLDGRGRRLGLVQYGIDAYYVEERTGEQRRTPQEIPRDVRVPMEMEVALGADGTAVLKGQRWTPLGIGVKIQRGGVH
jgi:uncharacterized membrane-anchored protein